MCMRGYWKLSPQLMSHEEQGPLRLVTINTSFHLGKGQGLGDEKAPSIPVRVET